MIVLDTHAWVWWLTKPERLGRRAARALGKATQIGVPAICPWEVAMKANANKIRFDRSWDVWIDEALAEEPSRHHARGQDDDSQCVPGSRVQATRVNYHPETDSLYIDLSEATSVESREVSEGVVLDYDETGNLVGIDIDNASTKVQMQRLTISRMPATIETLTD